MQESSVGDYRVEPAPRPWWRRRWFRAALAVVLLPVFVVAGLYFYMDYQGRKELKAAIAETDALDPNWQLDDIDASLKVIPDRANAALVVIDVKSLLPSPWPPRPASGVGMNPPRSLEERLADVAFQARLDPWQTRDLRAELAKVEPAVLKARTLADYSEGRFPFTWSSNIVSARSLCQHARDTARLLKLDAMLLAQDGRADEALRSGRANVVTSRAIGDEPMLISQLVRIACRAVAIQSIERTLAQSQPSEDGLAMTQRLLEAEDQVSILLICARGERAEMHALMERVESGELRLSDFTAGIGTPRNRLEDTFTDLQGRLTTRSAHAWMLRWMNEWVEVAKLPAEHHSPRLAELDQAVRQISAANRDSIQR